MAPRCCVKDTPLLSTSQKLALLVAYVAYTSFVRDHACRTQQERIRSNAYLAAVRRAWQADGNGCRRLNIVAVGAALKRWNLVQA